MKSENTFYTLIIVLLLVVFLVIAGALFFMSQKDPGLALGLGLMLFVVVALFLQQFISNNTIKSLFANVVSYENGQADVEGKRAQIQIETMKMAREGARVQNTLTIMDTKQIQTHANKLAGLLTDAEREKIKAQMMGYGGGDEEDSSNFTL